MAATARAFVLSRVTAPPPKPPYPSLPRSLTGVATTRANRRSRSYSAVTVSCLNGGGVSDEFVSTQKANLDRGFLVIANMLKSIEPLDTSVISKGVSDSAKCSMKQTISTMLGILPSDQFSVSVSLSRQPLNRLLFSSVITGYTLWNAEYRVSLARNLDISLSSVRTDVGDLHQTVVYEEKTEIESSIGFEEMERMKPQVLGDLPPEALRYIEKLRSELYDVEEELITQKKETVRIEYDRSTKNDLLEYLRSLDNDMVTELSRPSSSQVEEIIHQLVQNILQKLFNDQATPHSLVDSVRGTTGNPHDADEYCGDVKTSRDYLAKLLFWCMLLGHHLRGLENRLHLSCVVGLL